MFNGRPSNRGQILIIFVFAIIGLVGITGLAVDGGNIYSDRRNAQNAADSAALGAAVFDVNQQKAGQTGCTVLTTSCGSQVQTTALNIAYNAGYKSDIVNNTVEVHVPPIDGPYSNCSSYAFHCTDYLQVIIHTNVNTFFARVLGISQLHNRVEAVALAKFRPQGTLYGGNALVALNPHSTSCYGDVYFGGSGTITVQGGNVFVNSDNKTCAFKITNTCPTVTLVGGAQITGNGGETSNGCGQPPYTSNQPQVQYPPDPIFPMGSGFPPIQCNLNPPASYLDANGFTHYGAGHYASLPPDKNTVLDNGVFCVDNVVKTTNPTTLKNGPPPSGPDIGGVFVYIKPGGSFNFQGGVVNLNAPTSGMFKGLLFYVDESDSNWWSTAPNCTINGSSSMIFTGIIYAPHCDVTINGGSTPFGLSAQLVAFTIDLEGSAQLNFVYNNSSAFTIPEIDWTGLFR